jgi:hypothetical protein
MKLCRTSFDMRILTCSMSGDDNLLLRMHGAVEHSSTIESGSCVAESSRWMIWCSGGCSCEKALAEDLGLSWLGGPLLSDLGLPP